MLRTVKRWFFNKDRLIPDDNRILFFKRNREHFGFLSNFAEAPFELDGQIWPTVEHYYQAQKSNNDQYREAISKALTPGRAKRLGDHYTDKPRKYRKQSLFRDNPDLLRDDWNDDLKLAIMERSLREKFTQNAEIGRKLVQTADADLIEDSTRDSFWGIGEDGSGANHLGRLLMKIRSELQ